MANIKNKDISKLEEWNTKELRKLRMTVRNRINSFENSGKPKEISKSHPLYGMNDDDCRELLKKILSAEKEL